MQILELVIYSYDGRRRQIKFNLGSVNIITGKSKSGKSVVGDIIDYCLGGRDCNIADGIVRENVSWFGLLLQFDNERVFVARANPGIGMQTTVDCYIETGKDIESPEKADFISNINYSSVEEVLSKRVGIEENVNIPPEGQTREPLKANIRHALFYCFQNQDEIAAKSHLFHRQAESFVTQAIKDTLPYFLGAVNGLALELEAERKEKRREYTRISRALADTKEISGRSTTRGASLLSEAVSVGLASDTEVDQTDFNALFDYLKGLQMVTAPVPASHLDKMTDLQEEYRKLTEELSLAENDIDEAKKYQGYTGGYGDEVNHQVKRLESIGLFEKLNFETGKCPFCASPLESPLPGVDAMRASIHNLNESLGMISRERPRVQAYITEREAMAESIRNRRRDVEASIQAIYESEERLRSIRDLNTRRALVLGRISLWIESVEREEDYSQYDEKLKALSERLAVLDELLDRENTSERVESALSNMQTDMTEWAKKLELEGQGNSYRIDLGKATVVMDKDRPIALQQMGSGSNWVGVHLIAMFALHKFFISHSRPVPGFLFLDQPSQVYFPSMELKDENKDLKAVGMIYDFISDCVSTLGSKLQIIIMDHAQLDKSSFTDHVIESWWDEDKNLVPIDWIKK